MKINKRDREHEYFHNLRWWRSFFVVGSVSLIFGSADSQSILDLRPAKTIQ